MPEYGVASEPQAIGDRLIASDYVFNDLKPAKILWRYRYLDWMSRGKEILGQARVLNSLERFELNAELMVIIGATVWHELSEKQKEALIYHELLHFEGQRDKDDMLKYDKANRPLYRARGHDLEEFSLVVRKYGLWMPDTKKFYEAAKRGEQQMELEIGGDNVIRMKREGQA